MQAPTEAIKMVKIGSPFVGPRIKRQKMVCGISNLSDSTYLTLFGTQ